MNETSLLGKHFRPIVLICYVVLTALITLALAIALSAKIVIIVISALLYALVLGPTAKDEPPFGSEIDEENMAAHQAHSR